MTATPTEDPLEAVVRELCELTRETEWVEFKRDNCDPQAIGEYISALANGAALSGRPHGYVVWGIDNCTHDVIGTTFVPSSETKGNEPLESWLLRLLTPKIQFRFHEINVSGRAVVLLEIARAFRHPVRFGSEEFIRIGEVKKRLKEAPERERELWRALDETPFERLVAEKRVPTKTVLDLLDYPAYFDMQQQPTPEGPERIVEVLEQDGLLVRSDTGDWDITNVAALLFAKQLRAFGRVERKAVRVVQYRGIDRVETVREQLGTKGYASGFSGLVDFIGGLLPTNEVIEQALRRTVPMYPPLAVRELVANALIHQDLFVTGAGPMVEIFEGRVEITNPGEPLVDTQRFIDSPPRSRNETMASLMRRCGICEERGSGIDKVVAQVEISQLPAPLFEAPSGFTRGVLFAHKPLSAMDKAERVRACYLHACLRCVMRQPTTNTTIRERFGIAPKSAAAASRLLNEAVESNLIVIRDPDVGTRSRTYLPFWAVRP